MDLADATLVATAEHARVRKIFTIDRKEFTIYRIRRGHRGFHAARFLSEEVNGTNLLELYEAWEVPEKIEEWRERVAATAPTFPPYPEMRQ